MTDLVRSFEIKRADGEERMVYGIACSTQVATDGYAITKEAIEEAWPDFMLFGNVREMHDDGSVHAVGEVREWKMTDEGMFIGVYVSEESTWQKIKDRVLKGFSICGPILEKVGKIVTKVRFREISIVDRPKDLGALVTMFRAEGMEQSPQEGPQPQEESTMSDKDRQALAAQKPGAALKRSETEEMGGASTPAIEAAEVNILAEIGQHVGAIGSLVAKFNELHDGEKVAPEVLAHMQNSHRSMGKAMSAHLKASTSYGAKDESEAGAEETQRAEGIPHKPAGSKLDLILSRMDALESKVAPVEAKPADEGYKPVVVPETPLVAVAKEESVTRAEGGEPVDNDPKEGTPEWEALTEFKRFEIADRRNTQNHIAGKA